MSLKIDINNEIIILGSSELWELQYNDGSFTVVDTTNGNEYTFNDDGTLDLDTIDAATYLQDGNSVNLDGADDPHGNEAHTSTFAVDGDSQPPEDHGNGAHSTPFISDGGGTERNIWIIANGASDPADAVPEDIIFEEEA